MELFFGSRIPGRCGFAARPRTVYRQSMTGGRQTTPFEEAFGTRASLLVSRALLLTARSY